jgi:hypothetical protein
MYFSQKIATLIMSVYQMDITLFQSFKITEGISFGIPLIEKFLIFSAETKEANLKVCSSV